MSPTAIVLAGPNGAGKSTLYKYRVAPHFSGRFINADLIQRDELRDPSLTASYAAADIASARRSEMIQRGEDFVTETVFSHPSKLDLLREARDAGYETWVMHIGVEDADISVARVAHRVTSGGHNVPEDKIRERFDRSLILVREAVHLADVGLVYDNSIAGQLPKLVLTFKRGLLEHVRNNPPAWIRQAYSADLVRL